MIPMLSTPYEGGYKTQNLETSQSHGGDIVPLSTKANYAHYKCREEKRVRDKRNDIPKCEGPPGDKSEKCEDLEGYNSARRYDYLVIKFYFMHI